MASPAGQPCVSGRAREHATCRTRNGNRGDKENATRRAARSRNVVGVLQPSGLIGPPPQGETAVGRHGTRPRKRCFADTITPRTAPESRHHVIEEKVRPADEGQDPRVNPFDAPLERLPQHAAPLRSYRSKQRRATTRAVSHPPPRMLVSYADLWDGVSAIDKPEERSWDDDEEYAANYDFLYEGVWKRGVGGLAVAVEKARDARLGSGCGALGRRKRGRFRDLDRPDVFDDVVSVWED